jgi:hypothetical protein
VGGPGGSPGYIPEMRSIIRASPGPRIGQHLTVESQSICQIRMELISKAEIRCLETRKGLSRLPSVPSAPSVGPVIR